MAGAGDLEQLQLTKLNTGGAVPEGTQPCSTRDQSSNRVDLNAVTGTARPSSALNVQAIRVKKERLDDCTQNEPGSKFHGKKALAAVPSNVLKRKAEHKPMKINLLNMHIETSAKDWIRLLGSHAYTASFFALISGNLDLEEESQGELMTAEAEEFARMVQQLADKADKTGPFSKHSSSPLTEALKDFEEQYVDKGIYFKAKASVLAEVDRRIFDKLLEAMDSSLKDRIMH